jgi:hypothetical protein
MSEKSWIGGIYLKEEGGYEILLKSLTHYEKRLKTIHLSPELKEAAAMFAPVLQSQARKRVPMIKEAKEKMGANVTRHNTNSITRTRFRNFSKVTRMLQGRY